MSRTAITIVTDLIDSIDTFLYDSAIDIINYRRYVVTAIKIYKQRGPPTDNDSSIEVQKIMEAMDNSFNNYDIIHVAGTNGKGSVCLKLSNALINCYKNQGKKIGLLTSPHINSMRERIKINNIMISKYDFYLSLNNILLLESKLLNDGKISTRLIAAEINCLMAFWYFDYKQIDIGIIECNIGGKYDATNVIQQPLISIITSISFDHELALGNTIKSITRHKCGIIKYKKPIIIGPNVDKILVENYINDHNLNAPLFQCNVNDYNNYDDINIQIAKFTLNILKEYYYDEYKDILNDEEKVNNSLEIKQMGRLELHKFKYSQFSLKLSNMQKYKDYFMENKAECKIDDDKDILLMLDASHNPNGLKIFFESIKNDFPMNKYKYRVIYGCKRERRNISDCLNIIDGKAKYVHFISMKHLKPISSLKEYVFSNNDNYTEIVNDRYNKDGSVDLCIIDAVNKCVESDKCEIILCLGTMSSHKRIRQMIPTIVDDIYD